MLPLDLAAGVLPGLLFAALGLLIAFGIPIAFALIAASALVVWLDPRLVPWILMQRMYYGMDSFVLLAVPLFLLAGNVINAARVTDRLIAFALALLGRFRGALAQVNIFVSVLFGGVSGSSTADAAGVGTVLIPAMKREGYPASLSVAVTATSSVIGNVIPPSITMIVWGAITNTSIGGLFFAGIVPGLLIGLALMAVSALLSRRHEVPVREPAGAAEILSTSRDGLLALSIPLAVVGGIRFGWFSPTEAAVIAVLVALVLGFAVYRTLDLRGVARATSDTARLSALSLFSLVGASVFGYLISFYKLPPLLMGLVSVSDPTLVLLFAAAVILLVGTFMDALPATAILAPLLLPMALEAGVHPVHFGIVGVMALAFGLVTPPYGLCLLIAARIGGIPMLSAMGATTLYLLAMLGVLLACILFPELVLAFPRWVAPDLM
ncbi:TRAP transporter large permease [Limimaricola pyoseonensis]|uniref:TRAP transporter large permease protein n=1 Tax=Limimaricola pyoseonensis TaxID=521013 RepID=A0A1G7HUA2_9RHOB|nr:TRAP transporter large permease [Limimaricola pyoseonensis]SDF04111.1 TRAP transporter, DctM subunit [Limimaricola pyoseonensis]